MSKRDRENEKFIRDIVREQIKSEPVTDEQYLKVLRAHQQEELLKAEKKAKRRFFKPALVSCLSIVLVVVITLMSVYLPQRNGGGDQIIDGGNSSEPSIEPTPTLPPHYAEDDLDRISIKPDEVINYYSGNVTIENFNIVESYLFQSKKGAIPCYLYLSYANLFETTVLYIVLTDKYDFEEFHVDFKSCNELMDLSGLSINYNTKIVDMDGYSLAKFEWQDCKYYFTTSYIYAEEENRIETIVKQLLA